MSKKSRESFRGDNWCVLACTLGGAVCLVAGVTTLMVVARFKMPG
jgi:hypothetical protein